MQEIYERDRKSYEMSLILKEMNDMGLIIEETNTGVIIKKIDQTSSFFQPLNVKEEKDNEEDKNDTALNSKVI